MDPQILQPRKITGVLLNIYLFALCTVLPLYMPEGYFALGEYKTMLYRVMTTVVLVPCVLLLLCDNTKETGREKTRFDVLLLAAAMAQVISFVLSENRAVSLFGVEGWRDGFFSEITYLLLAYFFAHAFRPCRRLWMWLAAGPAIGLLITIVQCLFFPDPDRYFFSTVGNSNWYAGFLSVILPAGLAVLMTKKKTEKREALLLSVFLAVAVIVCVLIRSLSVYLFLFTDAVLVLLWKLSVSAGEPLARISGKLFRIAVFLIIPVSVAVLLLQLFFPFPEAFGNNRGIIWSVAGQLIKTFRAKEWLAGTGQDLFFQATSADAARMTYLESVFRGQSVTNAHAELLNMLVTGGLACVCTYLALLVFTLRHARKEPGGQNRDLALCTILVTASYLAHQTVSFRQVLATPFLYIMMGICFSKEQCCDGESRG